MLQSYNSEESHFCRIVNLQNHNFHNRISAESYSRRTAILQNNIIIMTLIPHSQQRPSTAPHQSLCSEMGGELCFALRCRGSRQRPALRRQCSKCLPNSVYATPGMEIPPHPPLPPTRAPPPNGLSTRLCPDEMSLVSVAFRFRNYSELLYF